MHELEAVGQIPGCTATLITQNLVLTAAHCVCTTAADGSHTCNARTTFTLENVFPVDDPKTPADESKTRKNVSIAGRVRVHPEYELRGWQREDIAIIELDRPANTVVRSVRPIPVESPEVIPKVGELLTLVGYGGTGKGCADPGKGKMKLQLSVVGSSWGGIKFSEAGKHVCPGDSGGPILNSCGRVVGVASWGNSEDESTYRPTSFSYSWIFNLPQPGWTACEWVEVGGPKSHNPGVAWCPDGSFLTQFDLDGDRAYAAHDTPIVGRARCCKLSGYESKKWSQCAWMKVEGSHQRDAAWCPRGSFMTQFDLDGDRSLSAHDAPIVGQAKCCKLEGAEFHGWGSCYWKEVGADSHGAGSPWGPDWGFLTAFDLDSDPSADGHDSPEVGQAMLCDLGLELASSGLGTISFDTATIHTPTLELPNGDVYALDMTYVPESPALFFPTGWRRVQMPVEGR